MSYYFPVVLMSTVVFWVYSLSSYIKTTKIKGHLLKVDACNDADFLFNESVPLMVSRKARPRSLLCLGLALIILIPSMYGFYTGSSWGHGFIDPVLDGVAFVSLYYFALYSGIYQPLVSGWYIHGEQMQFSGYSTKIDFQQNDIEIHIQLIAGDLYHCVLTGQNKSRALTVDSASAELMKKWMTTKFQRSS